MASTQHSDNINVFATGSQNIKSSSFLDEHECENVHHQERENGKHYELKMNPSQEKMFMTLMNFYLTVFYYWYFVVISKLVIYVLLNVFASLNLYMTDLQYWNVSVLLEISILISSYLVMDLDRKFESRMMTFLFMEVFHALIVTTIKINNLL